MYPQFFPVRLPQTMYADVSAQAGILRRYFAFFVGAGYLLKFTGRDYLVFIAMPGIRQTGVINVHEIMEFAVRLEPGNSITADGCFAVSLLGFCPVLGCAGGNVKHFNGIFALHYEQLSFRFGDKDMVIIGDGGNRITA